MHEHYFDFSLILYTTPPTKLEESEVDIVLPYFNNAETINIYYKEDLVEEIEISMYSDLHVPAVPRLRP